MAKEQEPSCGGVTTLSGTALTVQYNKDVQNSLPASPTQDFSTGQRLANSSI